MCLFRDEYRGSQKQDFPDIVENFLGLGDSAQDDTLKRTMEFGVLRSPSGLQCGGFDGNMSYVGNKGDLKCRKPDTIFA